MHHSHKHGFTIVELLIVIVVIAVLAVVTIVAFSGLSQRANETRVQTDLANAVKQLKLHYTESNLYPTANNCPTPSNGQICLKASAGTTFVYQVNNAASPPTFNISATNNGVSYAATQSSNANKVAGGNFVTLTNLATNGDFSSGSASWTNHSISPSIATFSSGVLTITADSTQRATVNQPLYGTYADNDKVFYSARIRRDSGSDFVMRAMRDTGGYASDMMTSVQFNALSTGSFTRQSGVRTYVAAQGGFTSILFGDYVTGRVFTATVDDVVVINLTSAFGVGNEPSAASMATILNQFTNGYFAGTTSASY